jgi:DNA polymerase III subunit delta'
MLTDVKHQTEAVKFLHRVVDGSITSPLILLGKSGVGRKFSIMAAMQELLCKGTRTNDCKCAPCYQLQRNRHPDVMVVATVDGKDIPVDTVREVIEESKLFPTSGKIRAFVIDGVDRFTGKASSDALLKTLEEPPARSRFFLLAEDIRRVHTTILSRGCVVRYRTLPVAFVTESMSRYEKDPARAGVLARMGEGSLGAAVEYCVGNKLALRDQVIKALQFALDNDIQGLFTYIDQISSELDLAVKFLAQVLHDVLIARHDPMRVIHQDISNELIALGNRAPINSWKGLARKVHYIQEDYKDYNLTLSYHIKTALVAAFI